MGMRKSFAGCRGGGIESRSGSSFALQRDSDRHRAGPHIGGPGDAGLRWRAGAPLDIERLDERAVPPRGRVARAVAAPTWRIGGHLKRGDLAPDTGTNVAGFRAWGGV